MASRRNVTAFGVLLLLALLLIRGIPFLTEKREVVASTPQPPALGSGTPLVVAPGSRVCESPVTYSPDSEVARVWTTADQKKPGPRLEISGSAPGYHVQTTYPGGYRGERSLEIPLRPPKQSVLGEFCLRNAGKVPVVLAGTQEGRTVGRAVTTGDGERLLTHMSLVFHHRMPASAISRVGTIFAHDAALNPLVPVLVWVLAAAALLLVPFLVFRGLALSFGAAESTVLADDVAAPPYPFAGAGRRLRTTLAGPWARVRALPGWSWLALGLALAGVWLLYWGYRTHTFQNDEARYVYLARWVDNGLPGSLFNFSFIDTGFQRLTIWLLAPVVGLFGGPTWVRVGHALQTALYLSTAIPVYLTARGLKVAVRWALFAAFLTVVVPWAVVATSFLTEPAAYPAFAFAVWAIWRSVSAPRWTADLLAVVLVVIAGLARVNLLALGGVLALAVVVYELRFGTPGNALARVKGFARRHWLLVAAAAAAVLVFVLGTAGVVSTDRIAGGYGFANRFHVPTALLKSKLDVYTTRFVAGIAFVPFAFGAAWVLKSLVRPLARERFAFALVGTLALAALIYTSAGAGFDERYLMYYAPVFAIACAVALDGRETPPVLVALCGLIGAYLLLTQSWSTDPGGGYSWFVGPAETAYASIFLGRLQTDYPQHDPRGAAVVVTLLLVAACVFAVSRRRGARAMVAVLVVGVIATQLFQTQTALSNFVNGAGSAAAAGDRARSWVDQKLYGRSHAGVFAAGIGNSLEFNTIWAELQFWNDSVTEVIWYGPPQTQVPPSDAAFSVTVNAKGDLIGAPSLPPYLVVPRTFLPVGLDSKLVASTHYISLDLVRLLSSRARWTVDTTQRDGYIDPGQTIHFRVYESKSGERAACADALMLAPEGLNSRVTLRGPGVRDSKPIKATKTARLQVPLHWSPGVDHVDLELTAKGKIPLADGRVESAQIAGLATGACDS